MTTDPIVLSTGDVRLPVHPWGGSSAPRRADQAYHPATGSAALREAIAGYAGAVTADQVIVTPGARVAILTALLSCAARGGEVLLPSPHWPSYPSLIRCAGGVPVTVPVPGSQHAARLVPALAAARTAATVAVVVNSPRNPDGMTVPADPLCRLVAWAERYGIAVLFDQVYHGVPLGRQRAASLLDVRATLPDHCVVVDGLSKSHALAGLRIGWAIAAGDRLARMASLAPHLFGGVSSPAQEAATAALRDGRAPAIAGPALSANLAHALAALSGLPGVRCARPAGGIFLFPDLTGWLDRWAPPEARADLVGWLRDRHGVAVADGAPFGAPGHVRLSFAVPGDQLAEGLRRLRAAVAPDLVRDTGHA